MNMPRILERVARFMLDEVCPPFLRDSRLFMWLPFRIAFGRKAVYFMNFKKMLADDPEEVLSYIYESTGDVRIHEKGTDLSNSAYELISTSILGEKVLDVGCGKGILADRLSRNHRVSACDISIDRDTVKHVPEVDFRVGDIQALPYADNEFDTVTCTHTLEHVWDVENAVRELRRVASRRLIVVLPRERPYRYAFNLHIHYFQYQFQVIRLFRDRDHVSKYQLIRLDDCWFYWEDLP